MKREKKHLGTKSILGRSREGREVSTKLKGKPLTNGVSGELWNFRWQHNNNNNKITTEFLLNYLHKNGSRQPAASRTGCGSATSSVLVCNKELERKGPLQSLSQRPHLPPNCEQAAVTITSFWDPEWFISARSFWPERLTQEIHGPLGTVHSWCTREPEWLGTDYCRRHMTHLGLCAHSAPGSLSGLDLGSTGDMTHLGLFSHGSTWSV